MTFSFNNLPLSLKLLNSLVATNNSRSQSLTRLATGKQYADNSPSAVLSNRIRDMKIPEARQASFNVTRGVSLNSQASAAVSSLQVINAQLVEIAGIARDGGVSGDQRTALENEFTALVGQYNDIVQGTDYDNIDLLEQTNTFSVRAIDSSVNLLVGSELEGDAVVQTGDATVTAASTTADGTFTFLSSISGGTGGALWGFDLGDIDGDGDLDLVGADQNTGMYQIFTNDGAGNYSFHSTHAATSSFLVQREVVLADFDSDGNLDIVSTGSVLMFSAGNGDGTFAAAVSLQNTTGFGNNLRAVDIDADGNMDLVDFSEGFTSPTIFLGNGDGTFGSVITTANTLAPGNMGDDSLSIGDVDGDGNLDLVVAHASGLEMFLGNGDGTFGPALSVGAPGLPFIGLELADFDNDGNLDIVAKEFADQQYTLLGNGDGTFQTAVSLSIGGAYLYTDSADVDQDGNLDLIYSGGHIGVAYGNGDGTFSAINTYPGTSSEYLELADINGDGFTDIVQTSGPTVKSFTGDFTYTPGSSSPATYETVSVTRLITGLSVDTASNADDAYTDLIGRAIVLEREAAVLSANERVLGNALHHLSRVRNSLEAGYDAITGIDEALELANVTAKGIQLNFGNTALQAHNVNFLNVVSLLSSSFTGAF